MRITIKYPTEYSLELFSSDCSQKAKEIENDCGKWNSTSTFDIPETDKIILKASYKKKLSLNYSLFKKDWLLKGVFSIISFDWWIPSQSIIIDLIPTEKSNINIVLDYDCINNSINGAVNKLTVQSIDSKKTVVKNIDFDKINKSVKNKLQFSLILGLLLNLLIYGVVIAFFLLSIFDYRFQTFKSNPVFDVAVVVLLGVLIFVNLVRFVIKYKDILNFLDNAE